jgi:hypothetical protein
MMGVKTASADDDIETSQQTDGNDAAADDRFPETDQRMVASDLSGPPQVSDGNVRRSHICHTYRCLNVVSGCGHQRSTDDI